MNAPRPRGTAIDDARVLAWSLRFAGFTREVTPTAIRNWLSQFAAVHSDLSSRLLDAVVFVSHNDIHAAFRAILAGLPGWSPDATLRAGRWRFVPYTSSAGESGDTMLHVFRKANGLKSSRFNELFIYRSDLLRQRLSSRDTVVFVDDFSGTGDQVCKAWKRTISELLPGAPTVFLVLVAANLPAMGRIAAETPLKVACHMPLPEDEDLFSPLCTHFSDLEKASVLAYCTRADPRSPRGYGDCGLMLVLAHGGPNNSIPILHATRNRWKGLFPIHP
jgi:hypothetical protein